MLIFTRQVMGTAVMLACGFAPGMVHAAPKPALETLDCRHLLAEDVRLFDRLTALQRSEARAVAKDAAPEEKGFFVKFDPVPGLGIMKGATLTPAGHPVQEDATERSLDQVRQKLTAVRGMEQRRLCPEVAAPDMQQDRLSDDGVRSAR
ncbi:hypothetical protein [Komagataeibacter sp. FNDCF1]|uniref:hypothetical protein n=1 Tax=Komagataeibacter sp. FNDCF1 TaxID=2878681 RepID=UPI001E4457DB|nr:hypothetical protein [Komagataeibacter sp. FNDCF1]MCE2563134.1 hypothetical protein [Komagataeibacter sp. FNDCF1]